MKGGGEGGLMNFGYVKFAWFQLGCQFCASLALDLEKRMNIR